jgi:hypothetical protein
LIVATVLGVYKPSGMTCYGTRKYDAQRQATTAATVISDPASAVHRTTAARWTYLFAIIAIGFGLLFVLLHFMGTPH